jgi:D-alanyl-D-alanine carboxypeptidase/D-alanyl-D-alanine-endopeptidase (penicillin-binding protein 4)
MKRLAPLTGLFCLLLSLPAAVRADLAADVQRILQDKAVKGDRVGVEIIRLSSGTDHAAPVCQINASAPLVPASNLKLVTTAAALELLGKDFRFQTVLALRGQDLALIGDGDPSLGDAELLRKSGWDVQTVFKNWAQVLRKRGITTVGDIYVDDSVFDEVFVHPNWPVEQQHKRYVAQVAGVNLNANCVDFYLKTGAFGEDVSYETNPPT